ncbi:MAG: carbohydrate kinase [Cyanobacteria bacterium J06627_15]
MAGSVVCIGEILIDCFSEQPGRLRADITDWNRLPGGAPANVACGLTKLGTSAAFVGAVGQDSWGAALLRLLQDIGVNSEGVQQQPYPTREVYVLLDDQGERTFAGFSLPQPDGFADAHLSTETLSPIIFEHSRYLVMGTLGLAYPETAAAIARCLAWANPPHCRVVMDVNWRPMFWPQPAVAPDRIRAVLPQVSFLKLATEEAEWLFETTDPSQIAQQNPQLLGVLVTAGAAGCRYWLQGHSGTVPGFTVDVEDTTGAGDAFVAGFVHQLGKFGVGSLQNRDRAHHMVTYACAAGALTTTRMGAIAAQPTPQEIDAFLFLNAAKA